jgi:hypothetical protein
MTLDRRPARSALGALARIRLVGYAARISRPPSRQKSSRPLLVTEKRVSVRRAWARVRPNARGPIDRPLSRPVGLGHGEALESDVPGVLAGGTLADVVVVGVEPETTVEVLVVVGTVVVVVGTVVVVVGAEAVRRTAPPAPPVG